MNAEYKSQSDRQAGYVKLVLKDLKDNSTLADVANQAIAGKGYCHLSEAIAKLALELMELNKELTKMKKKMNKVAGDE